MKLTEEKLRQLILEAMEEEREFDFSGMISKDLDYEGLRTVIELALDGEDIKYDVNEDEQKLATGHISKKATYTLEQPKNHMSLPYYWYMPFEELVDAFKTAGLPDENKTAAFVKLTTPSYAVGRGRNKRQIIIYDNS
tara:strand:+ start:12 stop:425 length:414 start_codon:yes stop_codon:yes gene_type:complete